MKADGARHRIEFGDFQTPPELAAAVCRAVAAERPATIIEPTCGQGSFLEAGTRSFSTVRRVLGLDVNRRHVAAAARRVSAIAKDVDCEVRTGDFFRTDWAATLSQYAEPILILGNPPWVTNATLGRLNGTNHPRKQNSRNLTGLEALTGKSNFDVSEWMIGRLLDAAGGQGSGRRATLAMLCKTAVAHKVLAHAWKTGLSIERSELRRFDATRYFDARVDACLLICRMGRPSREHECLVYDDLAGSAPARTCGLRDGRFVADVIAYDRVSHLAARLSASAVGHRWRSGVKHDCASVFEFRRSGSRWENGLGEDVRIESRYVFPLIKSSEAAAGEVRCPSRRVLVPQRRLGDDTRTVSRLAPRTWRYLLGHAERLDRRASAVYRNQPRFAVFGVGPYTFSRWKVVVSGFYKTWRFTPVGPVANRPVLCDDTCYFLPCRSRAEAQDRAALLNGERGREFLSAFVFNEAKRPLTAEILNLLDLDALARESTRRRPSRRSRQTVPST